MSIAGAMQRNARVLAVFAVVTTAAVALASAVTRERIAANERAVQLQALAEVMPAGRHDNDLLADVAPFTDPRLGDHLPHRVYRARLAGVPAGAVMDVVSREGYGGTLRLLVGVDAQGHVTGVRVVPPIPETPGLGDRVDVRKSPWIRQFDGTSLEAPPRARWAVKRDGGDFDQITGATITPRAVVKAVRDSLDWYHEHRDAVFAAPATGAGG